MKKVNKLSETCIDTARELSLIDCFLGKPNAIKKHSFLYTLTNLTWGLFDEQQSENSEKKPNTSPASINPSVAKTANGCPDLTRDRSAIPDPGIEHPVWNQPVPGTTNRPPNPIQDTPTIPKPRVDTSVVDVQPIQVFL